MSFKKQTVSKIDSHVGKRISLRRRLMGISQEYLAEQLDISIHQVQKYEKGVNRIAAGRLFMAGAALSVPVSYFYEGIGLEDSKTVLTLDNHSWENLFESEETMELIKVYYSIVDSEKRKSIVKFINSMK